MARKQRLMIRLTEDEKQRLQYAAQVKGVSMSEIIQDYCKRLPKPPENNVASRLGILVGIHLTANLLSSV